MDELTKTVIERGDLARLALFLWASGGTAVAQDRAALWSRVGGAEFLSDAEKRAMLGI